ncbi:LLM class flavin-dependent oxidoreductase [Dietzia sp.]|uniref:LLM class flavin-dependent oxidoreductase n=1 Tax=Dietzia sp. TaxID=1871616 RepID=UPI002FD9FB07
MTTDATTPSPSEPPTDAAALGDFTDAAARSRKGVPLSVLDLVGVSTDAGTALGASMESIAAAEDAGYFRYWYAEHHNTEGVASSATSVIIARAAAATESIRVGSGGIMLPNHAPLQVAEDFGTIAQLEPGRIDLGLGRAPGTDPMTSSLINHFTPEPQAFAQALYDLQGWFSARGTGHSTPVSSVASKGTEVPLWVLGSTVNGAGIAGQLGLPFAVASHFQPEGFEDAIAQYRETFSTEAPTARLEKPHVMVAVNVFVADTTEEARRQFTTTQRMFLGIRRGRQTRLSKPIPDLAEVATPMEIAMLDSALRISAVGTADEVVAELDALVEQTGADELITVTYAHDPADRIRSMQLLAEAWIDREA